jgi:hypothetical protein
VILRYALSFPISNIACVCKSTHAYLTFISQHLCSSSPIIWLYLNLSFPQYLPSCYYFRSIPTPTFFSCLRLSVLSNQGKFAKNGEVAWRSGKNFVKVFQNTVIHMRRTNDENQCKRLIAGLNLIFRTNFIYFMTSVLHSLTVCKWFFFKWRHNPRWWGKRFYHLKIKFFSIYFGFW